MFTLDPRRPPGASRVQGRWREGSAVGASPNAGRSALGRLGCARGAQSPGVAWSLARRDTHRLRRAREDQLYGQARRHPLEHRPPDCAWAGSSTGGRRADQRKPSPRQPTSRAGHRGAGSDSLTGLAHGPGRARSPGPNVPLGVAQWASVRNVPRGTSAWAGWSFAGTRGCRAPARSRPDPGSPCRRWQSACRRQRPGHGGR
jgi:hypothetical protein